MPKNVVQRLQKIENDLKSVISIYEVSNKCKNINGKSETQYDKNKTQLPQISSQEVLESPTLLNGTQTSQFDILSNTSSTIAQSPQEVYSTESVKSPKNLKMKKPISAPLSLSALSTIYAVSYINTKQIESSEKQDTRPDLDVTNTNISKTNLVSHSKKPKEKKENGNPIAGRSHFISSRESSILEEYPDRIPTRFQSPEENTLSIQNRTRNSQYKINENKKDFSDKSSDRKIKSKQPRKIRPMVNQKNFVKGNVIRKKDEIILEKKKVEPSHVSIVNNTQKTRKAVEHENEALWTDELAKTNEKLEKMKASKELALDIAKHLKKKYEEIQQSKQELVEELLKFQKDNEKLKTELQKAEVKIEELRESGTKQMDQDVKTKEILEANIRSLKSRIYELEKKLFEKQQEIEKIQKIRLAEIRNEIENKENQGREFQRLTNEKCELLARNEELAVLLNDRHLQMQYLDQKIRRLHEEVQTQEQDIELKTKALEETNTELKSICQKSRDLEQEVKILKKSTENFEETQNNLQKRIEEYEQQVKSNQEEMNKFQEENFKLKTDLENGKDALLIKTKIIEDQQETIKLLKEKSEEAKSLLKTKESLERILNIEREEKLELEEAVGRLKFRKEELKKKIKDLESDLILAPQKVARDLQKTQTILFELENQVYNKQKEWELQLHSLTRDKEQACKVAEYATKKLIQTNAELQKQSEAYKRLCKILAENLEDAKNQQKQS